jgi:hypothetical protein
MNEEATMYDILCDGPGPHDPESGVLGQSDRPGPHDMRCGAPACQPVAPTDTRADLIAQVEQATTVAKLRAAVLAALDAGAI